MTWSVKDDEEERVSKVIVPLTPLNDTVKLTLLHEDLLQGYAEDEGKIVEFNNGWPVSLSNMKSLLETGKTLAAF